MNRYRFIAVVIVVVLTGLALTTIWTKPAPKQSSNAPKTISKKESKARAETLVQPKGTTVYAIAASPDFEQDSTVFAVAFRLGRSIFLKSIDGGYKWRELNAPVLKRIRRGSVNDLVLSPNYAKDQTIFMSVTGSGVKEDLIKSEDGGQTWEMDGNFGMIKIAISPDYTRDQTLFISGRPLNKSVNGGRSWHPVDTSGTIKRKVESIAISPNYAKDKTIFVGTGFPGRTYKSADAGTSWSEVQRTNPLEGAVQLVISPDFARDRTLYSMFLSEKGLLQRHFRSTDEGGHWQELETPQSRRTLRFSPNYIDDQTIFATIGFWPEQRKTELHKSVDRGTTWTQVGLPRGPEFSGLLAYTTDKTMFVAIGDWGSPSSGVYLSKNHGKNWTFWKWIDDKEQ